VPLIMKE